MPPVASGIGQPVEFQAGRTRTAEDDVLTRAFGRLGPVAALLVAAAFYVSVGLALPLATGADVPMLIMLNVIGAVCGWVITLAWLFPQIESRSRRELIERTTDLRLLSAQEFEWMVGEMLRREGWDVEETGREGAPDGNVDLRIRRVDRRMIVQCKRWESRLVGVDEVRKLAGTLMREGLRGKDGMLVTLSRFTEQATAEANELGIQLVHYRGLLDRLERAGAAGLATKIEQARTAFPCPNCSAPMVLGVSKHGWWLHCPHYWDGCPGKRDLDPDSRTALELVLASR